MPRVSRNARGGLGDRLGRWQLLRRRIRRTLRPVLWGGAGVAIVLLLALMLQRAHPGDSLSGVRERFARVLGMPIKNVVIEGRANTPEPLLQAAIGVTKGDPILAFSVEQAQQRIESLSWVEHATVERRLPSTIVVSLTERSPFAIWQNQGKFVLIDRSGQVVANQNVADFKNLPLVVGEGAPQHAAALLGALAAQPGLQSRVVAAVRVGDRRWNLQLSNGMSVMLPEGAEQQAIARLMELQQQHALLDRPLAVVDMRLPDRLVLRPQPGAMPAPQTASPGKRAT